MGKPAICPDRNTVIIIIGSVRSVNTDRKMQKVVRLDSISRAQIHSASEKSTSNVEAEKIKKKNTM